MSIEQIRAREQAATDGPWYATDNDRILTAARQWPEGDDYDVASGLGRQGAVVEATHENNAEFISHARQDVPALLAAVDDVLAEVAEWDKSAEISDNTANDLHGQRSVEAAGLHVYHAGLSRNHAARIRTAITRALEGTK